MINQPPNTILMTADTVGGVWTYALDLCKVLQRNNIQVHLATMGVPLSDSQSKNASRLSNVELHESDFGLEWMKDSWTDVDAAGKWLLHLERQVQPELIHLNNYVHGSLPWRAPVLITAHSCVLSWWNAVHEKNAPAEWDRYRIRVKKGLQQVDFVTAVSRHMLECLQKFYGPFAEATVIHNARDAEQFYSGNKEPMIFTMGRIWDEAKNISSLRQIASQLSWPVYAAGDSGEQSNIVTENMILLGKISQAKISEWLSKTSIYVMPARYEPFGLSVLEAALSECALVLGNIPTLKEIWGDAALYVDPDDPEELKYKLNKLIENPSVLRVKAQDAMKRAQYFSMSRFENRYLNLYKNLCLLNRHKEVSKSA